MKSKLLSVLVNKLQVIFFFVAVLAQPYLGDTCSFSSSFENIIFTMVNPNNKEEKFKCPFLLYFFFSLSFKCLCADVL